MMNSLNSTEVSACKSTGWLPTTSDKANAFATADIGIWYVWIGPDHHLDPKWDWRLVKGLVVSFEMSQDHVSAKPVLEAIEEYGEGPTKEGALLDLLTSFADYYEWLEEREDRLRPEALEELAVLRGLVSRK